MKKALKRKTSREYELKYEGKATERAILSARPAAIEGVKAFGTPTDWANILIKGDNLPILKTLLEERKQGFIRNSDGTAGVRLVYIDPPFSTNLAFRGQKNQRAYEDKIVGAEFIEFLRKRLVLLRELLSDDGSIYVHLDWKKAHYIKAVMDEVFGEENFLNDIVWSYGGRGAKAIASQFSRNHDIILWYAKGKTHIFNQLFMEKKVPRDGSGFRQDSEGRWFKTSPRGDYTDESIEDLMKQGRVHRTRNGKVRIKYFLREEGGFIIEDKLVGDVWEDIPDAMHIPSIEKTGYPTQKPEALLSRVIRASTNPGDLVLDCFAGSGTTLTVAEKLGRRWIGVDSGSLSIHTIEKRLLSIADTRDAEHPKKRYGKKARPFVTLEEVTHCVERTEPAVKSKYSYDGRKDECVIKIERFSSPPNGHEYENLETLSSVMLDFSFDGEVFNLHESFTAEELKARKYEIRFPAGKVKGGMMVIYSDIFGNEKWFLGDVG